MGGRARKEHGNEMADEQINRVRQDIDALDEQLLALVNRRA